VFRQSLSRTRLLFLRDLSILLAYAVVATILMDFCYPPKLTNQPRPLGTGLVDGLLFTIESSLFYASVKVAAAGDNRGRNGVRTRLINAILLSSLLILKFISLWNIPRRLPIIAIYLFSFAFAAVFFVYLLIFPLFALLLKSRERILENCDALLCIYCVLTLSAGFQVFIYPFNRSLWGIISIIASISFLFIQIICSLCNKFFNFNKAGYILWSSFASAFLSRGCSTVVDAFWGQVESTDFAVLKTLVFIKILLSLFSWLLTRMLEGISQLRDCERYYPLLFSLHFAESFLVALIFTQGSLSIEFIISLVVLLLINFWRDSGMGHKLYAVCFLRTLDPAGLADYMTRSFRKHEMDHVAELLAPPILVVMMLTDSVIGADGYQWYKPRRDRLSDVIAILALTTAAKASQAYFSYNLFLGKIKDVQLLVIDANLNEYELKEQDEEATAKGLSQSRKRGEEKVAKGSVKSFNSTDTLTKNRHQNRFRLRYENNGLSSRDLGLVSQQGTSRSQQHTPKALAETPRMLRETPRNDIERGEGISRIKNTNEEVTSSSVGVKSSNEIWRGGGSLAKSKRQTEIEEMRKRQTPLTSPINKFVAASSKGGFCIDSSSDSPLQKQKLTKDRTESKTSSCPNIHENINCKESQPKIIPRTIRSDSIMDVKKSQKPNRREASPSTLMEFLSLSRIMKGILGRKTVIFWMKTRILFMISIAVTLTSVRHFTYLQHQNIN